MAKEINSPSIVSYSSCRHRTSFLSLPDELISSVFLQLDVLYVTVNCSLICKRLRRIVDGDPSLQYMIELAAAARTHLAVGAPVSKARKELDHFVQAWKKPTLLFEKKEEYVLPGHSNGIDLCHGIYAREIVASRDAAINVFDFIDLNTNKRWTWSKPYFLGECRIDPSSDLFATLSVIEETPAIELGMLSLASGEVHPLACKPAIHVKTPYRRDDSEYELEVLGPLIAVGYSMENAKAVMVFNWKTGYLLFTQALATFLERTFFLLSENMLLTCGCHDQASGAGSIPRIDVFLLDRMNESELGGPIPTASYLFPVTRKKELYMQFLEHPYPSNRIACVGTANNNYCTVAKDDLCLVQVRFQQNPDEPSSISHDFVILASTFSKYGSFGAISPAGNTTLLIPWVKWGPQTTRYLGPDVECLSSHAWRVALSDRILDFNPLDIARDFSRVKPAVDKKQEENYGATRKGLVHKPTVLPAGYLFVAEVETSLPYRESFVANELTCHAVLTDHLITLFGDTDSCTLSVLSIVL